MHIALSNAGTEFNENGRVSTAIDPSEDVQGQLNKSIGRVLLARHQGLVTIEANPGSELAKTLSETLDEHQSRYKQYYEHCTNRDVPHDEAWTKTHTDNVADYCESTNDILNQFRPQPTSIEGGNQARSSGNRRPTLPTLQTSLDFDFPGKWRHGFQHIPGVSS